MHLNFNYLFPKFFNYKFQFHYSTRYNLKSKKENFHPFNFYIFKLSIITYQLLILYLSLSLSFFLSFHPCHVEILWNYEIFTFCCAHLFLKSQSFRQVSRQRGGKREWFRNSKRINSPRRIARTRMRLDSFFFFLS